MPRVALHHLVTAELHAPAVVLSNSLGTTLEMWDGLLSGMGEDPGLGTEPGSGEHPGFGEDRCLIRYDHRGHGSSPVPPGPYSLEEIAGDLLGLLDSLGVRRASFCGVSLGGMVGIWLAAHAPDRIDRLVVCCSSPYMPPQSAWSERAAAVRSAGTVGVVADATIGRWLTPAFAQGRPDLVEWLRCMLVNTPADGYAACCEAIGAMDLRPALSAISAPTLVISAAQDPSTPPAGHGSVIADAIPSAKLVVVPDAAHMAAVERPDLVSKLIRRHLDRHLD